MIEVQRSPTHGRGVFATTTISRRTLIGIYAGRRYEDGEDLPTAEDGVTYLFGLSDGATIDGGEGGNETRFINHSCRPNCAAREAFDDADALVVEIRAKRRIRPGEELTLDYELVVSEADATDYACRCGESSCRETMAAVGA